MDNQLDSLGHLYAGIMLEHMPIGVALFDAQDLRLLEANACYHRFLNTYLDPFWRNGRAIGHPPTDWLPAVGAHNAVTALRTVADTGIPHSEGEYAFSFPGHDITYWKRTIHPVRDANGQIIRLVQTVSEVTAHVLARQQAEQASAALSRANRLAEAERSRLEVIETVAHSVRESLDTESIGRAAIDAIGASFDPVITSIHIADPMQQILHLLHMRADAHIEREAMTLLKHVPYYSPLLVALAPKYHDPIIIEDVQAAALADILPDGHPALKHEGHGYVCIPLWFKDHFEGTLGAFFRGAIDHDSPEVKTLVGCGTHLAEALAHARLHAAIEHERARLGAVLDQLPEGVIIIEAPTGYISYANAACADILGSPAVTSKTNISIHQLPKAYVVTNLKGRTIPSEDYPATYALRGKTVNGQEMMVTRPDGRKAVILCSAAPLYAEDDKITGAVTVFQDITARKHLEQQKNEFISIASHELRTPVTAIQGFAEILHMLVARGQSVDTPRSLSAIQGIADQSQRLTRLIEEMLDITRIENVQLLLDLAPHDLLGILTHVLESQAITTRKHHLQLALDGLQPTDTLMGYFDENRIEQVLNNLISNAIKYSPAGGEIEVGLRPIHAMGDASRPHAALMWVRDPGIGIAAHQLPHVFERFHRADNLARSIRGLGIGLYLAKELVERHGGRIWAESAEGKGSTFYVSLPLDKRGNLVG